MAERTEDILCVIENGIKKIVLNRPRRKNAISQPMYKTLVRMLTEADRDDNVCVVVLTGSGDMFSSGNDMNPNGDTSAETMVAGVKDFVDALIRFRKLLVAVVNGPAIGIAVTMLPLFDIVFASDKAYFRTPFSEIGFSAEGCSTYTFPFIMGHSKASEMLYLGYKMSAAEAKRVGLISDVYEHDRQDRIWAYLSNVSNLSQQSVVTTKGLVRRWNQDKLLEANKEESRELVGRIESEDFIERLTKRMMQRNKL